jgi:hypothetical protein
MPRTSSSSSSSSSSKSSSYGRSSSLSSPSYSSSSKTTPAPTPTPTHAPTYAPTITPKPTNKTELGNKTSGGGFMSSVMDGFGFGFGSSIAHRVVGGIFGTPSYYQQSYPHTTKVETHIEDKVSNTQDISKPEYISKPECKSLQEEYLKCIQSSNTYFQSDCDFSLNIFKDCETNSI